LRRILMAGSDVLAGDIIGDVIRRVPNLAAVEPDVTDFPRRAQTAQGGDRDL